MDVGKFRERIALQQEVDVADGMGGFTREWQTIDTLWANVIVGQAREAREMGQMQLFQTATVIIRRSDALAALYLPAMRFTWRGVPYRIGGVETTTPRDRYIRMQAETASSQEL